MRCDGVNVAIKQLQEVDVGLRANPFYNDPITTLNFVPRPDDARWEICGIDPIAFKVTKVKSADSEAWPPISGLLYPIWLRKLPHSTVPLVCFENVASVQDSRIFGLAEEALQLLRQFRFFFRVSCRVGKIVNAIWIRPNIEQLFSRSMSNREL